MRNLVGETTGHADAYIEDELNEARIPHFRDKVSVGEVKASRKGTARGAKKPPFDKFEYKFERSWYYWVVKGPVPIELAWELYNDPRGRYDVRVVGHCNCPEPECYTEVVDGIDCVTMYHIDSQDGLNLFAEKVLGTRPPFPTEGEQKAALEVARANTTGTVIYEDGVTEEEYLAAAQEISRIRTGLSDLRHRLEDIAKGPDKGMGPHSIALSSAHGLSLVIMSLYDLEDESHTRSFPNCAKRIKKLWADVYTNPTNYVLREKRDG
jgi:hypothetical protein